MNTLYSSEASFLWAFSQILYILYKEKALWRCFTPSQIIEKEIWIDIQFWSNDICLLIQFKTINNQKDKNLDNQKKCILKYKKIITDKIDKINKKIELIKKEFSETPLNLISIDIIPIVIYWWISKNRICLYLEDIENNKTDLYNYFVDKAENDDDKILISNLLRKNKNEILPIKKGNISSWFDDKVFTYSNNIEISDSLPTEFTLWDLEKLFNNYNWDLKLFIKNEINIHFKNDFSNLKSFPVK